MSQRAAFAVARSIGLTRREILKYSLIGASATIVAACTGQPTGSVADNSFQKFAEGTWYIRTEGYSTGFGIMRVTVNPDGTFTSDTDPGSGAWSFESGNLQIKSTDDSNFYGDWFAGATGIPEPVTDSATITWQQTDDPSFAVPIRWNRSKQTLEATGRWGYDLEPFRILISRDKPSDEEMDSAD